MVEKMAQDSCVAELAEFIKSEGRLKSSKKIAFYGGSFNPWHMGHQSCVELASGKTPVVVLPDHNPTKSLQVVSERLTDLSEIVSSIDSIENAKLFSGFFEKQKSNPTHYWFREIRRLFPKKKLGLVLGYDSFSGVLSWRESEQLLEDMDFIQVISRGESRAQGAFTKEELLRSFSHLEINMLGRHQYETFSSTFLREAAL